MAKKLAFTTVLFAVFLAALALVLHFSHADKAVQRGAAMLIDRVRPKPGPDCFEYFAICDQTLGWRNRPDGDYESWEIVGNPRVATDSNGYRKGGVAGDPVVCFVGDSYTFCAEVGDDETGPAEVSRLLGVPVLNAGVRGYGTLQCKRMLDQCIARFPSIKVVVYCYCCNDLEENLVQDLRYPARAPWMKREGDRFVEVEVVDPTVPWGASFEHWKGDRGRIVTDAQLGGKVRWAREHGALRCLGQLLQAMDQACSRRGVRFLATAADNGAPCPISLEFAAVCETLGIRNLDIHEDFVGQFDRWVAQRADGRLDQHYGPEGTKQFARVLAPVLKELLQD